MTPDDINSTLNQLFENSVQLLAPGSWQIDTPTYRLLVLLSDDQSWLRLLLPITSYENAQPFLEQFLEANFDDTQETRYAIYQNVLWGVYQHATSTLSPSDFYSALEQLINLHQNGLSNCFDRFADSRVRLIIQSAKQQGQTLESTLQNLNRFYEEGVMGSLSQTEADREQILSAWKRRLENLWDETEV